MSWANKRKQNTKMRRSSVGFWPSKSQPPSLKFKNEAGQPIIGLAIIASNNAISQTRPQRCRIRWTSTQLRLLRWPPQPRSLYLVCFRYTSRPHAGRQVVYRSDTIVVLVRGCCYSGHGSSNCYYLVFLGHISSSKAGFVQCFERREQFRRSVFFLWLPTEMTSLP